jgi:hypothetical protein
METKNLVVIARYNEDITWTIELDGDIVVYNKGNDWPWGDIPRIDSENYGREGETFVRAVLEFYESLNNYDNVIFLQGDPFQHCKDLINRIKFNKSDNIEMLTDSFTLDSYPEDFYIGKHHLLILDHLLHITSFHFETIVKDHNPNQSLRASDYDNSFLFKETMGLCTILGINYKFEKVYWSTGAQYIVPVKKLLSKSEDWWTKLHQLFLYYSKEKKIESWTYALERIWPLIWEHSDL